VNINNLLSISVNSFAAGFGLAVSLFTGNSLLVAFATLNIALAAYGIKQLNSTKERR
jgi:hypothetical protein